MIGIRCIVFVIFLCCHVRNVVHSLSLAPSSITKSHSARLHHVNSIDWIKSRALASTSLTSTVKKEEDLEEVTKKYGLEWGMFKALTSKSQSIKPKDLLKKYGMAYLLTSISLAIITFVASYILVSRGVDVIYLLNKIGIKATAATANAGTVGLAYAIHKAASPIRFPPTVVLTPVVAGWMEKTFGKKKQE